MSVGSLTVWICSSPFDVQKNYVQGNETIPFAIWIFLFQIDSSNLCIALVPFLGSLLICQVLVSSLPSHPQSSEKINIGSALFDTCWPKSKVTISSLGFLAICSQLLKTIRHSLLKHILALPMVGKINASFKSWSHLKLQVLIWVTLCKSNIGIFACRDSNFC